MNQDEVQNEEDKDLEEVVIDEIIPETNSPQEEGVPQLFSDEENSLSSSENNQAENFKNEEEFEIPAFLRKQKF